MADQNMVIYMYIIDDKLVTEIFFELYIWLFTVPAFEWNKPNPFMINVNKKIVCKQILGLKIITALERSQLSKDITLEHESPLLTVYQTTICSYYYCGGVNI